LFFAALCSQKSVAARRQIQPLEQSFGSINNPMAEFEEIKDILYYPRHFFLPVTFSCPAVDPAAFQSICEPVFARVVDFKGRRPRDARIFGSTRHDVGSCDGSVRALGNLGRREAECTNSHRVVRTHRDRRADADHAIVFGIA